MQMNTLFFLSSPFFLLSFNQANLHTYSLLSVVLPFLWLQSDLEPHLYSCLAVRHFTFLSASSFCADSRTYHSPLLAQACPRDKMHIIWMKDSEVTCLSLALNEALSTDGEAASIVSIQAMDASEGFGPLCSAWRIQGTCLLPADYTDTAEGTMLTAGINGVSNAWGVPIPAVTTNKTIYNDLWATSHSIQAVLPLIVVSNWKDCLAY